MSRETRAVTGWTACVNSTLISRHSADLWLVCCVISQACARSTSVTVGGLRVLAGLSALAVERHARVYLAKAQVAVEDVAVFANDGIQLALKGLSLGEELGHLHRGHVTGFFAPDCATLRLQIILENGVLTFD